MLTRYTVSIICAVNIFILRPVASAEPTEPGEVLAAIRAAWVENQRLVHTIQCSGTMESIYIKGGLSDMLNGVHPPKEGVPPKELTFSDQSFKWSINFDTLQIRRDINFVIPRFTHGSLDVPFVRKISTDLVSGNEYRFFRSRSDNPWIEKKNWELKISPGVIPFVEFDSLPIFWVAGCVSAKPLELERLKTVDDTSAWTYRGHVNRNGVDCFIVTMVEGRQGGASREYWVRAEAPYPILSCNMRTPRGVPWQLEVSYKEPDHSRTPEIIRYTEFVYPTTAVRFQKTFRIAEFAVNQKIENAAFVHDPKPGMIVRYPGKNEVFEVDSSGNIVPFQEGRSKDRLILRIVAIVISCFCASLLIWRFLRNRRVSDSVPNVNKSV